MGFGWQVLCGTSLGGGVAAYLAQRFHGQYAALVLENTFTSVDDMIPVAYPALRFLTFLNTNHWDTRARVSGLKGDPQVLFVSGQRDELVPPTMMQELFQACPSRNKRMQLFPNGRHNETCMEPGYYEMWNSFLVSLFGPYEGDVVE